jgi:hypothetical protein
MAREAAFLVQTLGSASPDEQLEAAFALDDLIAARGGAQRIQRAGGVPALVRLLEHGQADEMLQIAAASALVHMAKREASIARELSTAGAGRAVAQSLPSSSDELTSLLLELLYAGTEPPPGPGGQGQQLFTELAASPSAVERLAQLAVDTSDPHSARRALWLLAGPMVDVSLSAVAAAAAPHAAALVQHLSPRAHRTSWAEMEQEGAARLVALLANDRAELAVSMLAAGALPWLAELLLTGASPEPTQLCTAALSALERLVLRQRSAACDLAAMDGVAEVLVQLLASHQPPASSQQAWDRAEAGTSSSATVLLCEFSKADTAAARRAVTAGIVPQLALALRWGAQRLEWLVRQGRWEDETQLHTYNACSALLIYLDPEIGGLSAVTPALQAELPQLLQLVLQHCRGQETLCTGSLLLALLKDPSGGGSTAAPAGPSSSGAAAQAGGRQQDAVPAECGACSALPPAGRKFQVCAGCRAVRYCSPACQKAAWRSGHKAECREKGRASRAQG